MLPQEHRLSRETFKEVLMRGRSVPGAHFSFKYKKLGAGEKPRFSVVISKKVVKTATGRHLIKRRAYSFLSSALKTTLPVSGIFFARGGVDLLSFKELILELEGFLSSSNRR